MAEPTAADHTSAWSCVDALDDLKLGFDQRVVIVAQALADRYAHGVADERARAVAIARNRTSWDDAGLLTDTLQIGERIAAAIERVPR